MWETKVGSASPRSLSSTRISLKNRVQDGTDILLKISTEHYELMERKAPSSQTSYRDFDHGDLEQRRDTRSSDHVSASIQRYFLETAHEDPWSASPTYRGSENKQERWRPRPVEQQRNSGTTYIAEQKRQVSAKSETQGYRSLEDRYNGSGSRPSAPLAISGHATEAMRNVWEIEDRSIGSDSQPFAPAVNSSNAIEAVPKHAKIADKLEEGLNMQALNPTGWVKTMQCIEEQILERIYMWETRSSYGTQGLLPDSFGSSTPVSPPANFLIDVWPRVVEVQSSFRLSVISHNRHVKNLMMTREILLSVCETFGWLQ